MKTIKVMRDGRPATAEELECAVAGKPLPPARGSAAPWTGQKLHEVWAESCPWSSIGFERDWDTMHPHRREKWNELAKAVNGEVRQNEKLSHCRPTATVTGTENMSEPKPIEAETRGGSCAPAHGSASGETLDEWKLRHGIDPKRDVNQDELLMSVEESRSKEKSWCLGCDKHMPVREMKLITRSTDPYVQSDEGETDYIAKTNRIRMCPACYKEQYETED